MGTQINKGTNYANGGQVTFTNLNDHVDNATLAVGCITAQAAATTLTQADTFLLQQGGALREATVAQMKTAMTLGDYLKANGTVSMTTSSQLTLGTTQPLSDLHAVPLKYLTSKYIPNSGTSSASGALSFNGTLNVGTTTNMSRLTSAGIQLLTTNQILTLSKDPVAALEAAPKQYVDKYSARLVAQWNGIFSLATVVAGSYTNNSTTSATFTSNGHGFIAGCRFYAEFTTGTNPDTTLWTITAVTTNTFTATPFVNVTNANSGTFSIRKCVINSKNERGLTLNSIIAGGPSGTPNTYILNTVESIADNIVIITSSGNGLTSNAGVVSLDYSAITDVVVARTNQSLVFICANQTGNKSGLVIF